MSIITRGFGAISKLLTRGFGADRKEIFGGSVKRKKVYSIDIIAGVFMNKNKEFRLYFPVKKYLNKKIKVHSNISKSQNRTISITSNINHKKLICAIEAL